MMQRMEPALLRELAEMLRAGGIEDAELEAKWICEDMPDAEAARETARRRAKHEPLQYLLGAWEFYGLRIEVGQGVLIPRADTETLVEAALDRLKQTASPRIMDLCTGSGCIALALKSQMPDADVTGIEKSAEAMKFAEKNRSALGLDITLVPGDVLQAETAAAFTGLDCIVSNPPYLTADDMAHLQQEVTYEPASALDGGADGLHFYREITRLWRDALKPGGLLAFEIGCTQGADAAEILRQNDFEQIAVLRDLNGNDRVVQGIRR